MHYIIEFYDGLQEIVDADLDSWHHQAAIESATAEAKNQYSFMVRPLLFILMSIFNTKPLPKYSFFLQ